MRASCPVTLYRLRAPDGEELGVVPSPVPNMDVGDVVVDGSFGFWEVLIAQDADGSRGRMRTLVVVPSLA